MGHSAFMELLEKVKRYINKINKNIRSSIPTNQRPSDIVRNLASDLNFEDFKYITTIAP